MHAIRIRVICSAILAVLLNVAATSAPVLAAEGKDPRPTGASLVFVTKGDACNCVANLCVAGEQEVLNFLGANGSTLRYERIDLAEDPGAGMKYRAVTLPVVLLFDRAGEEIARFDSFFTEAQLTGVWQHHLAAREGEP